MLTACRTRWRPWPAPSLIGTQELELTGLLSFCLPGTKRTPQEFDFLTPMEASLKCQEMAFVALRLSCFRHPSPEARLGLRPLREQKPFGFSGPHPMAGLSV